MDKHLQVTPPVRRVGIRHVQIVLMAVSSFVIYILRTTLSVGIVAMVDMGGNSTNRSQPLDMEGNSTDSWQPDQYSVDVDGNYSISSPPNDRYPVYDWDEQTQGLILSSFFWGYLITQVPAGILTQRYGGHIFLFGGLLSTSILTVLLPPCTYWGGVPMLCFNRMLQGVTQGFVYPSAFAMMGLWTPPLERSTLSGIVLGAQTMGPVAATPLAGILAANSGWPSIFYSFGALGIVVSIIVYKYTADSPARSTIISGEERAYIEAALGGSEEKFAIPWRKMLTSVPTWAAILTMAFQGGVFLTFLTKIPSYLSSVLKFEIKDSGVLSALPYLSSWILSFIFSSSCDWITSRNLLSITQARKLYNTIAHVVPAMAMILLGYTSNPSLSVLLLCICIGVMSASYPGVQSNFMDLAPNFSGTIFSISNFLNAIGGVVGPIMVGLIVTQSGSLSQWRIVYFLFAAVMFFSNVLFVCFGTAEVQKWNYPEEKTDENKRTAEKLSSLS